jgi:predicted DNA binding protein
MDTRAELMLRSATEYAILALQGHDFSGGCLNSLDINDSDNLFNVKVNYHYFLTNCNPDECNCSTITTADTNGSVLIYVTVTSKNPNFHIRKVRFTLQNP